MPIMDDFYGISSEIEKTLDSVCYDISTNSKGLKYLQDNNIKLDELNDYHLETISKNNDIVRTNIRFQS